MATSLPKIVLDSKTFSDVNQALRKEWLVTNGLGGYASSTILGVNTRKYHGLLVAAFNPPVDRRVLLTKLDEEIAIDNEVFKLSCNELQSGMIHPGGYRFLSNFALEPLPTYIYEVESKFRLQKTIFMPHGKNATVVIYEVRNHAPNTAILSISPAVNFRHFHSVTEKHSISQMSSESSARSVVLKSPSGFLPSVLILASTDGCYEAGLGEWTELFFRVDASRGESCLDNSHRPGVFKVDVAANENKQFAILAAGGNTENEAETTISTVNNDFQTLDMLRDMELKRRVHLFDSFQGRYHQVDLDDWLKWLVLAADAFIVERSSAHSRSVTAGYHWFEDWGRDSLISLPGLTLVTGRFEDARQILLTFKRYCRNGLIPNRFPDSLDDQPVYNTVDATLWFFDAVLQYLKYTNDFKFVEKALWSTLESIIENHVEGTSFNIHVDDDGLLIHGPQLTWMDAAPNGVPVTPREGKAVEIQALWYNALRIMQLLSTKIGESQKAEEYSLMAEKTVGSFNQKFWNQDKTCFFDVVNNELGDSSLRPNQVITCSLDFSMPSAEKARIVVDSVQKHLWGVYGLKTLSNDDPRYRGRYQGNLMQRDHAYHNGTVWPWLLGPFVKAFLKTMNYEGEWRNFAFQNFLQPLFTEELFKAGSGYVAEIFDGDPPHDPNGCIAQAWSVAEPLRAYIEDVLLLRPPFEQAILKL
jgi:predicted glycogen debranching enzyme